MGDKGLTDDGGADSQTSRDNGCHFMWEDARFIKSTILTSTITKQIYICDGKTFLFGDWWTLWVGIGAEEVN